MEDGEMRALGCGLLPGIAREGPAIQRLSGACKTAGITRATFILCLKPLKRRRSEREMGGGGGGGGENRANNGEGSRSDESEMAPLWRHFCLLRHSDARAALKSGK